MKILTYFICLFVSHVLNFINKKLEILCWLPYGFRNFADPWNLKIWKLWVWENRKIWKKKSPRTYSGKDSALPLQGSWVPSLIRELGFCMLHISAEKINPSLETIVAGIWFSIFDCLISWIKEFFLVVLEFYKRQQFSMDWVQSISVQFSCVQLFATPGTAAHQASLSITNSRSLHKLMSIELVMPSSYLILCHPLLLPPSIFPSIRVFSNESVLCIRWPNYWNFSFSISPSNEYSGLISFRMDWLDLLEVQGTHKSLRQHHT